MELKMWKVKPMNRAERRRAEKQGVSKKAIIDKTLQDAYEQGYKAGMKQVVEITFYMVAYTINYKLGFGRKRLQDIMKAIYNNIDAYRTGHLEVADYDTIKEEMENLGVRMK